MRRRQVHGAFGLVAAGLAVALGWQLVALQRVESTNRKLAAVPASLAAEGAGVRGGDPGGDSTPPNAGDEPPVEPRARLAWATALAVGGATDAAERLFVELAGEHEGDPLGRAARFDLGNGYLRDALSAETDPRRAGPLVELAKQRYRDLLRETPDDWDVRYNLERALRFAPERGDDGFSDMDPVKSVDVVVPDFVPRDQP